MTTYEIENLETRQHLTDIDLGGVVSILAQIGANTLENIEIISQLNDGESAVFGATVVTCQAVDSEMEKKKEKILQKITEAFWGAMEEEEREFQAYLATNPGPLEKFKAVQSYYTGKRISEQKYMMMLAQIEQGNLMDHLQLIFGEFEGGDSEEPNSSLGSLYDEEDSADLEEDSDSDDWI